MVVGLQVCKEGQTLNSHQAALLRHFDVKMAVFRLKLVGVWRNTTNQYEVLGEGVDTFEEEADDGDDTNMAIVPDSMKLPAALRRLK